MFPCLEEQGPNVNRCLEKCGGCESWCCMDDIFECSGRPVRIPSIPRIPGSKSVHPNVSAVYKNSARAHPPKRGSSVNCNLPGWKTCDNPRCWSRAVCPECASSGTMCLCQEAWECDLCAEHDRVMMRCPRCDRPFCPSCCYIDKCFRCERESLCDDCVEEASDADDKALEGMPVTLIASCGNCGAKACKRCVLSVVDSCVLCCCLLCEWCTKFKIFKCLECERPLCSGCVPNHLHTLS